MNIRIRPSTESDLPELFHLNQESFGEDEGPIIVGLIKDMFADPTAQPLVSLVATDEENTLLGHIIFTHATLQRLKPSDPPVSASPSISLIAPLAVKTSQQKKGIGQALIAEGLNQLKSAGVELVFVLGHPEYYPKAGFAPAGNHGFDAPYPIPEEHAGAWMVIELVSGSISKHDGKIQCCKALDEAHYWSE